MLIDGFELLVLRQLESSGNLHHIIHFLHHSGRQNSN